jgi:peptidoglycan pentaglycine glycine transferase (the first glycine)
MLFNTKISKEKYDEFVLNHPKSHFMQSYAWGEVSRAKSLIPHYVGIEEEGNLIAVSLLLQKKLPLGYSYFYAPRGYVIDFNDNDLLKKFTDYIKDYAKQNKGIFVKIDPDVKLHNIDGEGNPLNDGFDNHKLVNSLIKMGYKHHGFNKNFENSQPRYTFRLDITKSIDDIRSNMHPTTRKILNRGNPYNLDIRVGTSDDIKKFFELMKVTSNRDGFVNSTYDYYYNYYSVLNNYGMSDIYLIEVSIKDIISKTEEMINSTRKEMDNLDGKKNAGKRQDLEAKINKLEEDLKEYKTYPSKYEDNIVVSSIITAKYGNKIWTIHGGNHDIFRNLNYNYLLYYKILLDAKENGYEILDFFGTTGNPDSNNKIYGIHLFKKRFGGEYMEFIGEFDLVTNKPMYFIFTKVIPLYRKITKRLTKIKNKKTVK